MSVKNFEHRTVFQDVSGSTILLATDDLSATERTLIAAKAKYTIHVQKIVVNVITDNAATLTFRGITSSTPVIAGTKASPGIGPIVFDFGEEGRALDVGEGLELANSAAGLAADITWTAYRRPAPGQVLVPSEL